MMAHAPWQPLGLSAPVSVGTEWKKHRFTFYATKSDGNARVTFSSLSPATYQIAGISFRQGGVVGLPEGQQLEDESVAVLTNGESGRTEQVKRDFIDFLWHTEHRYWVGMYRYLKEELGVRSLVCGTQLSYGPVHIQAQLDYIDAHAYWQHPRFPGRPWDPDNWYIENVALVNSPPGTLGSLAERRVLEKPFTVSEYNHSEPNQYSAEGFPMLAGFAAFQDWDGIYSFAYSHNLEFEPAGIGNYFDIKSHPAKLAHMIACAAMFLRGDVCSAEEQLTAGLSRERERQMLYESFGDARTLVASELGISPTVPLEHRVAMSVGRKVSPAKSQSGSDKIFVSDTNQITWNVAERGKGYFVINSPRTKVATGFISGRSIQFDDVSLEVGKAKLGWATVSLVCLDGRNFREPGRVLVTATGLVKNRDAVLQHLSETRVTLGRRFGRGPVVCEGVPLSVSLPCGAAEVRAYALDERGDRREEVTVRAGSDTCAVIEFGPRYRTIWYELDIGSRRR